MVVIIREQTCECADIGIDSKSKTTGEGLQKKRVLKERVFVEIHRLYLTAQSVFCPLRGGAGIR